MSAMVCSASILFNHLVASTEQLLCIFIPDCS
jgi:hypothetical protein